MTTHLAGDLHVVAHDEGDAPDPDSTVCGTRGNGAPIRTNVAEQDGVGGRRGRIPAKSGRPVMLQGEHNQLLLSQILPCMAFHRVNKSNIPSTHKPVVSSGEQQIIHRVVLQLAHEALVETAAPHTGEQRRHGPGCRRDGRNVPEEDPAVFTCTHQHRVVRVDNHIRDFPAVTSDGLPVGEGENERYRRQPVVMSQTLMRWSSAPVKAKRWVESIARP